MLEYGEKCMLLIQVLAQKLLIHQELLLSQLGLILSAAPFMVEVEAVEVQVQGIALITIQGMLQVVEAVVQAHKTLQLL
jgi:hypothetical protein